MTGWNWVRVGAVLGFLAVALGAFGAHGLKARLETIGTAANYQTAVQYHMFHALAVLALGVAFGPFPTTRATNVAGWSFLLGVVVFSGSLYVLSVTGIKRLGAITPFGGVAMLAGWVALVVAASQAPTMGWTDYSGGVRVLHTEPAAGDVKTEARP
jgi:uncharacterized membrane protein YgdD (TMEM256/DUF423 family)